MDWVTDYRARLTAPDSAPRYEVIATALTEAIAIGRLQVGERLPAVRRLARLLGVSDATVVAAYGLLARRGWTRGEVGRGTFVAAVPKLSKPRSEIEAKRELPDRALATAGLALAWRRRALVMTTESLRARNTRALDGVWTHPDPTLLPLDILQRAWSAAIMETSPIDLQYPHAGNAIVPALTQALLRRLAADGVPARETDMLLGPSVQHLILLALDAVRRLVAPAEPIIAVEEPGHQTFLDILEQAGYRLVGVEVDAQGAVPAALDAALADGATAALLTPRAHNPTGASWSSARMAALADVVAGYPNVVVIENDYFAGLAATRPGSLFVDRRLHDRVVYLGSFSKTLAPDLRLAVAVVRPHLRPFLSMAMYRFGSSWVPRLMQRAVAHALADPALEDAITRAQRAYRGRRAVAIEALTAGLNGLEGGVAEGDDGLGLWVWLPTGVDAAQVIVQAADLGVLVASGENFFIQTGRTDGVRLCVGRMTSQQAATAGRALATAITRVAPLPIAVPLT